MTVCLKKEQLFLSVACGTHLLPFGLSDEPDIGGQLKRSK